MADLADVISQIYALESALLRAHKLSDNGKATAQVAAAITGLLADESMSLVESAARRVLTACAEGDALQMQITILRRLTRFTPGDAVAFSRRVAAAAIASERYPL
jgi:butyryl-CoA dehydrogenase